VLQAIFTAALVLTIMIIPITSAICRELFIRVPRELMDGALALGSTRWEAIRGVMFAYAAPGIVAAVSARSRPGVRRGDRRQPDDRQRTMRSRRRGSSRATRSGSKIASEYVGATVELRRRRSSTSPRS
jgi:hypothetical protein